MGLTEALEEAYRRWGEAAAVYKDRSRGGERYEVGYFRQKGNRLFFHVMGSGNTLEIALTSAPAPSLKPAPSESGSTPNNTLAVTSGYERSAN